MKEATGDLGMTIIVILGIGLVLVFGKTIWETIQNKISGEVDNIDDATPDGLTSYNYSVNDYFKI